MSQSTIGSAPVPAQPASFRLLVVDDEPVICELLAAAGRREGWTVETTSNPTLAQATAKRFIPDAVILDVVMPEMDGIEVLTALAADGCGAEILILSGHSDIYSKVASVLGCRRGLHCVRTIRKPIALADIKRFLADVAAVRGCPTAAA